VGEDEPVPDQRGRRRLHPRNVLHSTYNSTWSPLRLIVVYTPGGAETVLDSLPDARILDAGRAPVWAQAN